MPKANRKGASSMPFQFTRQFTAPPFFMGLNDAKHRSELLLEAMKKSTKLAAKTKTAKSSAKKKAAKKKPK